MPNLKTLVTAEIAEVTAIRHDLHAHPELCFKETRTSKIVCQELQKLGIEYVTGLGGGTGVLGFLPSTSSHTTKAIALRADMDALPIIENTGLTYTSTEPGVMHACGHDGHTSILIGTARVLAKSAERPNDVLFIFQPAEEDGGGGQKMVEDGVLEGRVIGPKVDTIFGLHCHPHLAVGMTATKNGPIMASTDVFRVQIIGRGGHAAYPHSGVDPIVTSAQIINTLQTICSRNVDPLDSIVCTVSMIHAGTASNIIPDFVQLVGTIRTLRPETRSFAEKRLREILAGITNAMGATYSLDFQNGYPVTINHPDAVATFRSVVGSEMANCVQEAEVQPAMGAEDFSYYGYQVPACFYWLGLLSAGQTDYPNLHAPEFDFNDEALPSGIRAMASLALRA